MTSSKSMPTSRLGQVFKSNPKNQALLIPFITAGFPNLATTVPLLHGLTDIGIKIIELGIPFSDPMADGPSIQRANFRAIDNGAHLAWVLESVKTFRQTNQEAAIVLMGYMNPIEAYGLKKFVDEAASSGVDGLLIVDAPPEESEDLQDLVAAAGLDMIFLLAPTTLPERQRAILTAAERFKGYLYFVSMKGVTGGAALDLIPVREKIDALRQCTALPIGVGFGIRDAQTARAVAAFADGVVIGSRLIDILEDAEKHDKSNPPDTAKIVAQATAFIDEVQKAIQK